MTSSSLSDQVRGKTFRLLWTEGPTSGMAEEHIFHQDGTVEWHPAGTDAGDGIACDAAERPPYVGMKITADVCLVSYLAKSGCALTLVLNFIDYTMGGVASNAASLFPVRGRFSLA